MTLTLHRRGVDAAVAFDPATLSPSLWLKPAGPFWQESTRSTPATADADPVGAWDDSASGAKHATQPTAANRPLLKLAVLNGRSVLRFDGTNDVLQSNSLTATATQTLFVVCRKNSALSAATKTVLALGQNAQLFGHSGVGTGYNYFTNQAAGSTVGTGTPTSWNIVALTYASTSSAVLRVGGGAGTAFDPSDTYASSTLVALGARDGGIASWGDYDIAEVLRFSAALSLANHDRVGRYLAAKHALTWAAAA